MKKMSLCKLLLLLYLIPATACGIARGYAGEEPAAAITDEHSLSADTKSGRTVYLTFDDGPSPATGDILDALREYGAHVTFFMLEPHMKQFPDEVNRMVGEGQAVALHGVTHDKQLFYSPYPLDAGMAPYGFTCHDRCHSISKS